MSSFLLSLVSPVLHRMICGNFKESNNKEIVLKDVQGEWFMKLMPIACGANGLKADGIEELFELGVLAERLGMIEVVICLEDMLISGLSVDTCSEMLRCSELSGLERVRKACHLMLRDRFQEISRTEGFLELSEETLSAVLEDEQLGVNREEVAYEAVIKWMKTNGEEALQGEKLLMKIRYGAIRPKYLECIAETATLAKGLLKQLVGEVLRKKGAHGPHEVWDEVERLCQNWRVLRKTASSLINLPAGTIFGDRMLKDPLCVAVDPEGRILVTDTQLQQIIVFDRDGCVERRFGSEGSAAGQFKWPVGVVVDVQGQIIVADSNNHRIQVIDADWSVARCFGSEGTAVGQLKNPMAVAMDPEGRIVVADWGNHRIQVFNEDGSVARHFGSKGAAAGQLDGPVGVAVDEAGCIVVADRNNHRVQVFKEDGSVILCFGSEGSGLGKLKDPRGVTVDKEGRFVVADHCNHRIQVFNSDGSVAHVMGSEGTGVGQLKYPYGVAVDGAGRIIVVEALAVCNHRVQIL